MELFLYKSGQDHRFPFAQITFTRIEINCSKPFILDNIGHHQPLRKARLSGRINADFNDGIRTTDSESNTGRRVRRQKGTRMNPHLYGSVDVWPAAASAVSAQLPEAIVIP